MMGFPPTFWTHPSKVDCLFTFIKCIYITFTHLLALSLNVSFHQPTAKYTLLFFLFLFCTGCCCTLAQQTFNFFSLVCKRMPLQFGLRAVVFKKYIITKLCYSPNGAFFFWDSCREQHATCQTSVKTLFTTKSAL